jgi:hypothetical protein
MWGFVVDKDPNFFNPTQAETNLTIGGSSTISIDTSGAIKLNSTTGINFRRPLQHIWAKQTALLAKASVLVQGRSAVMQTSAF